MIVVEVVRDRYGGSCRGNVGFESICFDYFIVVTGFGGFNCGVAGFNVSGGVRGEVAAGDGAFNFIGILRIIIAVCRGVYADVRQA